MVSQNNLKQIVIALHNYHAAYGRFPPAVVQAKDGRPLYSWRVMMLPYLEEDSLYREFHLDEPWDSPHNLPLLPRMPRIFAAPRDEGPQIEPGNTFYQVFIGPGTAFENPRGAKLSEDFPEGTANTIMIIEAGEAVPWTKPADLVYQPEQPLPPVGGIFTTEGRFSLFGSNRVKGFNAAFADGSTRWLPADLPEAELRAMIAGRKLAMTK